MTTKIQAEPHPSSLGRRIANFVQAWLLSPVIRWHRRNELYREMMGLDDRTLADIGISRYDIPYFVRNTPIDDEIDKSSVSNDDTPAHPDEDDSEPRLAA